VPGRDQPTSTFTERRAEPNTIRSTYNA
jgi:hypothetical protein